MLTLVTGGAASGKSEYAERLAVQMANGVPLIYLATMQPYGEEGAMRIERHRLLRAGKGFETIECCTDLAHVCPPEGAVVLLECLTNLAANELFCAQGAKADPATGAAENAADAQERILRGLRSLCAQAKEVVAVSGEVFSDGVDYDEDTRRYLQLLAGVNRKAAGMAAFVVEVVHAIPVIQKDERGGGL